MKSGSNRTQTGLKKKKKFRAREGQTERLSGESQILTIQWTRVMIIAIIRVIIIII